MLSALSPSAIFRKIPNTMQMCADVIGRDIAVEVLNNVVHWALRIFAAVAAGIYDDAQQAQKAMAPISQSL